MTLQLVSLLLLGDAPTSARLKRDRTAYSKAHARIRISNKIAALNELEKILTRLSEIGRRLETTEWRSEW